MSRQLELGYRADGETFDGELDGVRLGAQMARVRALLLDGRWRTLAEIAVATGDPEASVSARVRDLRKPRFGGYDVQRRRRPGLEARGVWEYRLADGATAANGGNHG
ncbi:MAG TPA: hypothetical protein VHH11_13945 [Gammaproteobacteria bacterium]|nr:hypothetical protein [Gammaproteobacteria bacterium]